MTATMLGVQGSSLFVELNFIKRFHKVTPDELMNQEIFFYLGVSVGGIVSVILFASCFQRKQYFMSVWINSLYAIYTSVLFVLFTLDSTYGDTVPGILIHFYYSSNVMRYFIWGVYEQTSTYVVFYILPILLAIKFRNSRNFATMAGTIIGVINLLTMIVHYITASIFATYIFEP